MKLKLIIPVISGVLIVILLVIDKYSNQSSVTDKWVSFGLGLLSAVFVGSILASISKKDKEKTI